MDGFEPAQLAGPLGGMLALAFAAGSAGGWGFALITVVKFHKEQVDELKAAASRERQECDRRITQLEARVREVEDRYTQGMERQLSQIRQSSVRIVRRSGDEPETDI